MTQGLVSRKEKIEEYGRNENNDWWEIDWDQSRGDRNEWEEVEEKGVYVANETGEIWYVDPDTINQYQGKDSHKETSEPTPAIAPGLTQGSASDLIHQDMSEEWDLVPSPTR